MSVHLRLGWLPYLIVLGVVLVSMVDIGLLDPRKVFGGARNSFTFGTFLFPPRIDVLSTVARAMLETLQIALVGTVLGFVLALPLSLLATRSLYGRAVTTGVRTFLSVLRTVPSLLWAIVFVVAFGLGPAAGALGIAFYTVGYLGKLFYEALDGVDSEVIEAVWSTGANRLQLARYAVLPEAANSILSQLLFIFEYNVRASTILGFVGAGGIGFYILGYIQLLQYDRLLTALLVTLVVVLVIDQLSALLRARVLPPAHQTA